MWTHINSQIPAHIQEDIATKTRREDNTDRIWLNINTGALIVLACDGGWRDPENARYIILHYAPGAGVSTDITYPVVVDHRELAFDARETGAAAYNAARNAGTKAIEAFLGIPNALY